MKVGLSKSYSTRALRTAGLTPADAPIWAKGSYVRNLYEPKAVRAAVHYVLDSQGEPMSIYFNDPLDRGPEGSPTLTGGDSMD